MRDVNFGWSGKLFPKIKRNHIGYQFHDFVNGKVGSFFIKLYCSIISGMWSILLLLPIESWLSFKVGIDPAPGYTNLSYMLFFALFTLFFVASSALMPRVKDFHIKKILKKSVAHLPLNPRQRVQFLKDRRGAMDCKAFLSKEGMLSFIKYSVAKNIEYASLYFALENLTYLFGANGSILYVYVSGAFFLIYGIAHLASDLLDRSMTRARVEHEKRCLGLMKGGDELSQDLYKKEVILNSVIKMFKIEGIDEAKTQNFRDKVENIVQMIEINLMFQGLGGNVSRVCKTGEAEDGHEARIRKTA
jgi:hypothetical protein